MVARGAGAAGPVLLACRPWDPLGLALWLPVLEVGAWRSAPLLPWRVQCPVQRSRQVRGARAGTWCCVSPICPFPPRVFHAVCGAPSCPDVPYPRSLVRHSTQSVRSASSVRLPFWQSPRALCLCVRSRSRGVRFPPPLGGMACAPRAVPALGAGRAVPRGPCPSACPGPVPCSVWRAWGGAARSRFPPTWLGVVRPPWGGSALPGRSCAGGWRGGGGGPCAAPPCLCDRGGKWRGGSLRLVPSLCLPWTGNKAGVTGVVVVMEGVAPIPLRFVLACLLWARSVRRPGALARVRLLPAVPVGAGGWCGGCGPCSGPSQGRRGPAGGRGDPPLCLRGGGGRRPRGLRAGRGGWGGGGCATAPRSPSGGQPAVPYPAPPLVVGAFPPGVRVRSGSRGRPVHRMRPAWRRGGGEEGRPVDRPSGGPFRPEPSLCPPQVGNIVGVAGDPLVKGGAAPILFRCAAACRPPAWSARRSGALVRARPSAATPAGAGSLGPWGARCAGPAVSPSPRVAVPSGGGGASPWLRGRRGSALLRPLGREGAEGGEGGPLRRPLPPRLVGCRPAILCLRRAPPGYTRAVGVPGEPWASSLLLRETGPKDKAVNTYSQTTSEFLRCILMSSEKRHQQATFLDGSGLRRGHPSPLSATRQVGFRKVVQVRSSLL